MITAKLDATEVMRQYSSALRRLASLTGFSQSTVLRAEAGVILKQWAGKTKVATQKQADGRTMRRPALSPSQQPLSRGGGDL